MEIVQYIIFFIILLCGAIPWIRENGYFEVFYFTHLSYIFFWILLIVHEENFWIWFLLPGTIFIISKLYGIAKILLGSNKSYAVQLHSLSSKVTKLVVRRTDGITFSPGDYVLINIPAISRFEWHPFTISSAPEQQHSFSLHIRAVGGWTNGLLKLANKENKLPPRRLNQDKLNTFISDSALSRRNSEIPELRHRPETMAGLKENPITVYIDGPHGAPSSSIFSSHHAILVATGIGVTPFASILQSVVARLQWHNAHPYGLKSCFGDFDEENRGLGELRHMIR
ncbi:NADPH oxidase 5 [Eurytemora carolleeae]|uniref:NADPH oxidase 5 n=1 Tax=Eurytemora carolleeae TaxID=1294199 RepID=UPI000C763BA5|nr:NADPH oxidase 5 [Eurytemora carolleeae]|eukprot:XP_023339063.1 NADPH oxidase 5-like [Eurytemora affinis]